jgi:sugar/nucleoside kinase (ribokinase family)
VPRLDLVTVGETFQDLIFVDLPRLPRPGEELKSGVFVETVGGGAAITAVAAARLGLRVQTITAAGRDAVRRLAREGVSVVNLRRTRERHAVTVALSTRADRSFVTFNGVNAGLQPRLAISLHRGVRASHVHFAFSPERCGAWTRLVNRLRARGVTTSWDFGWDPSLRRRSGFRPLVAAVDFVFVNEPESRLYRAALSGARTSIVKIGRRGSRWIAGGTRVAAVAPRVAALDTTGAGDAFNGGFLFAYLRGRSPRACLDAGNYVGARSTLAAGGIDALPARWPNARP